MKRLALCAALLLGGCATAGVAPTALLQVQPGMTREAVTAMLGQPGNRSFRDDAEALQYCRKDPRLVAESETYETVWLREGRVVGMTTRTRPLLLTSCANYPDVDWGQIPADVRVEVRSQ